MVLLIRMLHKRIGWVVATIGISILAIIVSLWWNWQLSIIINLINIHHAISLQIVLTAAEAILVSSGISYILGILSGWTCETLTHDLRMGYARYFSMLPLAEIEKINAGEQISRLQNEINDVSGFLNGNLFPVVDDAIRFAATFSWMLWLNPKLTISANLPVVFIMWYIVYSSKIIGGAAQQSQQANTQMCGYLDTLITAFPILRIFEAFPLIRGKYDESLQQWEALSVREERTRAKLMSLSALLSCIPLLLLFLIGGSQVIQGETAIGTLYVFINLSGNVSGVMMNMPGRIAGFRRFLVNMKRLQPTVRLTERGE